MDSSPTANKPISDSAQPYYTTGDHLHAKHTLIRNQSGRTIERWALDLVPTDPTARILDAGSGWGRFSWRLLESHQLPAQIYPNAEDFTQSYLTIGGYRSLTARADISAEAKTALLYIFCELAEQVADEEGTLHVPVLMGALICTEPGD